MQTERKILRYVGWVLQGLAVLILIGGLIGALVLRGIGGPDVPAMVGMVRGMLAWVTFFAGLINFLLLFAAGGVVSLIINIEENTSATAVHTMRLATRSGLKS